MRFLVLVAALLAACSQTTIGNTTNIAVDSAGANDLAIDEPVSDADPIEEDVQVAEVALAGYTLYRLGGQNARLIDMDGNQVHAWQLRGLPMKMLPGGELIGSEGVRRGYQEAIELLQVSWTSEVVWSFSDWDDDGTGTMMSRQHHDFQREGNPVGYFAPEQDFVAQGKTLILAHETRVVPEISDKALLDEVIYEVDWSGQQTGFSWRAAEHVDGMGFDAAALAELRDDPNFNLARGAGDWLHVNAISRLGRNRHHDASAATGDERFHPDNIILSARKANFIAIISAATGEIVWRIGPDMAGSALGQIVGPHHAHMIPWGLPGAGNVLVFDNGGEAGYGGVDGNPRYTRQYSRVLEIDPISQTIAWQYGAADGEQHFFSPLVSGAQRLPNGNTLATIGTKARIIEVTRSKKNVWEFQAETAVQQIYRASRVPPQWLPAEANTHGYPDW